MNSSMCVCVLIETKIQNARGDANNSQKRKIQNKNRICKNTCTKALKLRLPFNVNNSCSEWWSYKIINDKDRFKRQNK